MSKGMDSQISDMELLCMKYLEGKTERGADRKMHRYSEEDTDTVRAILKCLLSLYQTKAYGLMAEGGKEAEIGIRSVAEGDVNVALPLCEDCLRRLKSKEEESRKRYGEEDERHRKDADSLRDGAAVYDGLMAIAASRSLKHFALYMDLDQSEESKTWTYTLNIFGGFWHYLEDMVLTGRTHFIEKQLPTGYGKSYSDVLAICWIFGVDKDTDIIKVFGAAANVTACFEGIKAMMLTKRYSNVFPYYAKFNGNENDMFSKTNAASSRFTIRGSKKPLSLTVASKELLLNGARAKYLFLDDITQFEDASNIEAHKRDISKFKNVWFKRCYDLPNFFVIVGGTTYSRFDLLSYVKERFGYDEAVKTEYKYTMQSKSNLMTEGGGSIFVSVPALDYDTDESTYPKKFPTMALKEQRDSDYETFEAMMQQTPLPLKSSPFSITNLNTYEALPKAGSNGRPDYHYASLDTKRGGADSCAMPIFSPFNGKHYLVTALFDDRPMNQLYEKIVAYIIEYKIIKIYVEDNICEGIDIILKAMLAERGYYSCNFIMVYDTEKKDTRISRCEGDIKASVVFPKEGMYTTSSEFGRYLDQVQGYSYIAKMRHDDAPDSLSIYVKKEIIESKKNINTFSIFSRC
jgi:hypothetical protein